MRRTSHLPSSPATRSTGTAPFPRRARPTTSDLNTLQGNQDYFSGGGIYLNATDIASPVITRNTIDGNRAVPPAGSTDHFRSEYAAGKPGLLQRRRNLPECDGHRISRHHPQHDRREPRRSPGGLDRLLPI